MAQTNQIKIGSLIKIQAYGDDPALGEVTKIEGDKISINNGNGEIFLVDASDCSLITEAEAIAQGLL